MKIKKEQTLSLRSGKATVGEGTALGRRGAGVLGGPSPASLRQRKGWSRKASHLEAARQGAEPFLAVALVRWPPQGAVPPLSHVQR